MNAHRSARYVLAGACVAALCCPALARAQVLFGTVRDDDARPVAGVLVTLRDSALQVGTRVLTDEAGRFYLRPRAGRYHLSFEHIGYAPQTRAVELPAAEPVRVDVQLATAPVVLGRVVAEGKGRCGSTKDPQAAQLWYLTRTALGSLAVETRKRFRIRRYLRDLDVLLRPQSADRAEVVTTDNTHSFRAEPAASLLTDGFVQRRDDGLWFFGPDAELLMSDGFVNGHCFRIAREKSRDQLVGLAFAPGASKLKHDIRGTIWIDQRNGELKLVEYVYTGLDAELDEQFASGRVEYDRLEDGSWIIRRWYIRMPLYSVQFVPSVFPGRRGTVTAGPPVRRVTVQRIVEEGAEVIEIRLPQRAQSIVSLCSDEQLSESADLLALPTEKLGVLTGSVRDNARPVTRARVRVKWNPEAQPDVAISRQITEVWAETNEFGVFTVCGLPLELDLDVEILEGDTIIKTDRLPRGRERVARRAYQVGPSGPSKT